MTGHVARGGAFTRMSTDAWERGHHGRPWATLQDGEERPASAVTMNFAVATETFWKAER